MVRGHLSDHYDPRRNVVRLSQDVYYGTSITSVAVAAHECGHAMQHAKGYAPLNLRSSLVPVVNFASNASWLLIALGLFMNGAFLKIGILLFSATVLFQLVTLPCEFNASKRANKELLRLGLIDESESRGVKTMLKAAAFTYVAGLFNSILQLLRLVFMFNNRRKK